MDWLHATGVDAILWLQSTFSVSSCTGYFIVYIINLIGSLLGIVSLCYSVDVKQSVKI